MKEGSKKLKINNCRGENKIEKKKKKKKKKK